jgi:hypothetical protein
VAVLAAGATLAVGTAARADETDFQRRFTAAWSGGGNVVRDADTAPKPTKVSCTMAGSASGDAIAMDGTCRAYLLFSRPFEAKVRYDASSGRYVGVYEGANSGPAALSGRREGDTLNLTITWAKPVNGDRTARLSIRNDGRRIAVKLTDEAQGRQVTTTDLTFAQR